jgi:hypothetical protein
VHRFRSPEPARNPVGGVPFGSGRASYLDEQVLGEVEVDGGRSSVPDGVEHVANIRVMSTRP